MKEMLKNGFDNIVACFLKYKNFIGIIIIFLIVYMVIYICIKSIRKNVTIEENETKIEKRLFKIKISCKTLNKNIYKFIIGRCYTLTSQDKYTYSIYMDIDNEIIKLKSVKSYGECVEIINQIKTKTRKRIYDDTDTLYLVEEDLFRNYYKSKRLVEEIKYLDSEK